MRGRWLQNGMLLAAAAGAATLVAAAGGRPAWAAAVGGGLAVACWALEWVSWRRCLSRPRFGEAVATAAAGAGARVMLALAGLALVGLLARPAFATAAVVFLAVFTLNTLLRVVRPATLTSTLAGGGR